MDCGFAVYCMLLSIPGVWGRCRRLVYQVLYDLSQYSTVQYIPERTLFRFNALVQRRRPCSVNRCKYSCLWRFMLIFVQFASEICLVYFV